MAHPRKLIRQAVVAQLLAASTSASVRVYATRMIPHQRTALPAVAVYTPDESVDPNAPNTSPRELERVVQLVVEGCVSGDAAVDDVLDDFAEELEAAVDVDRTFGGTANDCTGPSTRTELVVDGDRTVGLVELTYSVTYHTFAPLTVPTPDAFLEANIHHNLGGAVHPDNQAEDVAEPEQ